MRRVMTTNAEKLGLLMTLEQEQARRRRWEHEHWAHRGERYEDDD